MCVPLCISRAMSARLKYTDTAHRYRAHGSLVASVVHSLQKGSLSAKADKVLHVIKHYLLSAGKQSSPL